MIQVVIADDHTLFREGVKKLLSVCDDLEVVGEAANGREAVEVCDREKPDVLLLDLDLPGMDGFEVTREMTGTQPRTRILVLTMHAVEEFAVRLIRSGAAGFMLKDAGARDLPEAIRKVAAGKTYLAPVLMDAVAFRMYKNDDGDPVRQLSDRELQVVIRLAKGMAVADIGNELSLSPKTVETYRMRAMNKLGLGNLADLARFAMRMGLIKDV